MLSNKYQLKRQITTNDNTLFHVLEGDENVSTMCRTILMVFWPGAASWSLSWWTRRTAAPLGVDQVVTSLSPLFLFFQTLINFENHENQARWWAANGVLLALSLSLVREFKKKNTWPGLSSSIICINLEYFFSTGKLTFLKPVFTRWLSDQRLARVKICLQYTNQGALGYEIDKPFHIIFFYQGVWSCRIEILRRLWN